MSSHISQGISRATKYGVPADRPEASVASFRCRKGKPEHTDHCAHRHWQRRSRLWLQARRNRTPDARAVCCYGLTTPTAASPPAVRTTSRRKRRRPFRGFADRDIMAYTFSSLTAHFLKSVSFERIGRIQQRQFVNQLCGVEKNGMYTRPCGGRLRPRVSTIEITSPTVLSLCRHGADRALSHQQWNKQNRFREGAVQFRYTAGHAAGMPVLQDVASGREPQVVLFIRRFRRRFERQREITALPSGLPELVAFARFHVRVVTFAVAPLRFFCSPPASADRVLCGNHRTARDRDRDRDQTMRTLRNNPFCR